MATTQRKNPTVKKSSASKSTVAKQQEELIATVNEGVDNVQSLARKSYLAGLGAIGRTVEEVRDRVTQANKDLTDRYEKLNDDRQKLVQDLIDRGEKVQGDANDKLRESRESIEQQIEVAKQKLGGWVSVVDIPARLQEMSDRLESLSKELKKTA